MNVQIVIICNMLTPGFWDVMLCFWVRSSGFFMDFSSFIFRVEQFNMTTDPEAKGITIAQTIKNYLLNDTVSYPRRLGSLATPWWEQILIWKTSIGNYAHYAVPHPRDWSLQQHYCKKLKSIHGRLSLWLFSMYSLGNPEQNCENPVMTALTWLVFHHDTSWISLTGHRKIYPMVL